MIKIISIGDGHKAMDEVIKGVLRESWYFEREIVVYKLEFRKQILQKLRKNYTGVFNV